MPRHATPEQLETLILEDVEAILGPDGVITLAGHPEGKSFSHNPAQYEYAQLAAQAFCREDPSGSRRAALTILQAATGTGKSIGYLVPLLSYSARSGQRVAVSTFTRHLQEQLLNDVSLVAEWIRERTGVVLRSARRVGRSNYVSASSVARLVDAAMTDGNAALADFLERLLDWVEAESKDGQRINSGILDDFLRDTGLESLPAGVSHSAIGLSLSQDDDDLQQFHRDLVASKDADVLIVNHTLSVMNSFRWGGLLDSDRQIAAMVFDEADRLPTAADSAIAADVPLHKALSICERASIETGNKRYRDAMVGVMAAIDRLRPDDRVLAIPLTGNSPELARVREQLQHLKNAIGRRAASLAKQENLSADDAVFCDLAVQVHDVIQALSDTNSAGAVSWSPVRAFPSVRVGQAFPGRILARMWAVVNRDWEEDPSPPGSYFRSVLFTSATLGIPGRPMPEAFDLFMQDIGIQYRPSKSGDSPHFVQTDLFRTFEPSSFGSMKFVLADPRVEPPFIRADEDDDGQAVLSDAWLGYAAKMVRAAQASGGRTLVLTTSFVETELLEERLQGVEGVQFHRRGTGLRSFLADFKSSKNGVLITPAGWEGIDLPGVLSHVVITRLPNIRPDSIRLMLYRMALERAGMSADMIGGMVMGRIATETRRRLAQGIGRGIRRASDRVTIWIADPRFPLPEEVANSMDPVVLEAPPSRARPVLASAIPLRFRKRAFPAARLFLENGTLHTPIV
ncbi:ATP-dependent DNA helicase [Alcanivorax sp. 1008]|uniref:ATP-dependent DNA helicase n=1 Tax=Alcanivorax sp. 1008 TaxID=2816853 RepID=UPI001E0F7992|nr:helicase C-terminal domain-containing protein [Alcanivorax sp. 1008]MCC1496769.1 hypothetical protein [Alcanivorax sp. 1008]